MNSKSWLVVLALSPAACGDDGFDPRGARSFSDFSASADGWLIASDSGTATPAVAYDMMGGFPDGAISANDEAVPGIWYFQAPQKYLGTAALTYAHKMTFDLKTTDVSMPIDDFDVILQGGGFTLAFDTEANPTTTEWTTYTITLDETAGWKKIDSLQTEYSNKERFMMFVNASKDEIRAVLADFTLLRIRGEFSGASDTGLLDNVRFGAN